MRIALRTIHQHTECVERDDDRQLQIWSELGPQLKEAREKLFGDRSLRRVAREADLSDSWLRQIERGYQAPRGGMMLAIYPTRDTLLALMAVLRWDRRRQVAFLVKAGLMEDGELLDDEGDPPSLSATGLYEELSAEDRAVVDTLIEALYQRQQS